MVKIPVCGEHVGLQTIKALDEMGIKVYLCASTFPERRITTKRFDIDVSESITGFMKAFSRSDIPPFLKSYQMMLYSYFFVKKLLKQHKPSFIIVTGVPVIMPAEIADRALAYIHFPVGLFTAGQSKLESRIKKFQIKSWQFISNINKVTLLTNSNYEKNLIGRVWDKDATVVYPPCPQYSFSLSHDREDAVCSIARFTPEKNYETILEVARRLPNTKFELIGSINPENYSYYQKLTSLAPKNVSFHSNATVEEKIDILKKAKVLLHTFPGEHFGISIVEAMSAGIIPVTYDSGAPKVDGIVQKRFRYLDTNGAVKCVNDALSSWNWNEALRLREAAKVFSPESFAEGIKSFISNWIKSKKLNANN